MHHNALRQVVQTPHSAFSWTTRCRRARSNLGMAGNRKLSIERVLSARLCTGLGWRVVSCFVRLREMHERHSSRGMAVGDIDNDGDLDILIWNRNEPPSLLRNDLKSTH